MMLAGDAEMSDMNDESSNMNDESSDIDDESSDIDDDENLIGELKVCFFIFSWGFGAQDLMPPHPEAIPLQK